eukprot:245355-Prymnesium_polylepis.2
MGARCEAPRGAVGAAVASSTRRSSARSRLLARRRRRRQFSIEPTELRAPDVAVAVGIRLNLLRVEQEERPARRRPERAVVDGGRREAARLLAPRRVAQHTPP